LVIHGENALDVADVGAEVERGIVPAPVGLGELCAQGDAIDETNVARRLGEGLVAPLEHAVDVADARVQRQRRLDVCAVGLEARRVQRRALEADVVRGLLEGHVVCAKAGGGWMI
jgi:hypothetical protein